MWTRIEVYQILGQDSVHVIERKTSEGMYVVRVETGKKPSNYQTREMCGLMYGLKLEKPLRRERGKQEWANEKPKFDNARRLRCICYIDPEDGE